METDEEKEEDERGEKEASQVVSRESAASGRDTLALTTKWWEVSRPRKRGAILPAPAGSKVDFHPLFEKWLNLRGLSKSLERESGQEGFFVYRLLQNRLTPEQERWDRAFHGTRCYALWLILGSGVLLSSFDKKLGHDFWEPGVYCTPVLSTARWYGRPHVMFGDGVYHRAVVELRVDPRRRKRERQRGGMQWVFPEDAVIIRAVWMQANAPPDVDEQRFDTWEPDLEALPPGWQAPEAVVNPRKGPYPLQNRQKVPMRGSVSKDQGSVRSALPMPGSVMSASANKSREVEERATSREAAKGQPFPCQPSPKVMTKPPFLPTSSSLEPDWTQAQLRYTKCKGKGKDKSEGKANGNPKIVEHPCKRMKDKTGSASSKTAPVLVKRIPEDCEGRGLEEPPKKKLNSEQHFRWPSENYFFNHVTGEQCWDTSKMDTCCPWEYLKVCFQDASELPDGSPYGYVLAGDETWERDIKEGGRRLHYGWAELNSTCVLKPKVKKIGHKRWHNNLAWKIEVPQGTYTVRLGMLFQLEPTQHAVPWVTGHVNQERIEVYVRDCKIYHEHIVTTNVMDIITISGDLPIYYVHIQAGECVQLGARQPREPVPSFSHKSAHGVPKDWNRPDNVPRGSDESALYWGNRAKKFFSGALERLDQKPMIVNLQLASAVISEFLHSRPGKGGVYLLDKLGPPLLQDDGWFCFAWRPYLDMARVSENSFENMWTRAWHGCKFEALYSIMYHGQLLPSRDKSLGDRLLGDLPGVYVHKDDTARKANNYVRFVPLRNDGVFWAAKWEVRVNRKPGIPLDKNKKTDQWIQPAGSVRLAALWLCGRTAAELHEGDPVAREWNAELEAHPLRTYEARMTHLQNPPTPPQGS